MPESQNLVVIGVVGKPHGIRGFVKVRPLTDFPERYYELRRVFLVPRRGPRKEVVIEALQVQGEFFLLKFAGIDTREQAEQLRGMDLAVPQEECVKLPPDHYYHFDLIGLRVVLSHGETVGTVTDVQDFPAQDILIVRTQEGAEVMIPFVKEIVLRVSLEEGIVELAEWPGLLEGGP